MRNILRKIVVMLVMLLSVSTMQAVPAYPGSVVVHQPDGTTVTLLLHGDEWLSYHTTIDGYSVVQDQHGYYVYAQRQNGQLVATQQVAHDAELRSADEQHFLSTVSKHLVPEMSPLQAAMKRTVVEQERRKLASRRAIGDFGYDYSLFRGLIILVQYSDRNFSRYGFRDLVYDMVNQEGFSGFDNQVYTGSVLDYFSDNSNGLFRPHFDVAGPVTISYSQYSANGTMNHEQLINAAIDAVDAEVDFSQYDGDGDGSVDMIYFIFSGNGSNYTGNDQRLMWPHRFYVLNEGSNVYKDGIRLWDYAVSTELIGATQVPSSIMIDGIGTICHEFSHVLGLPDLYDTDYAESGGRSVTPEQWSLLSSGNYLNYGRTPAGYSLFERWAVGWTTEDPKVIRYTGDYDLDPLFMQSKGYRINTPNANEFFLLENRQQHAFKWDAYLPGSGLLVHRVDLSDMDVWASNKVNVDPQHNYYKVIRAAGESLKNTAYDVFPGSWSVTTLSSDSYPANLRTWDDKSVATSLSNISTSGYMITFHADVEQEPDNLALFCTEEVGAEVTLRLDNAEVLYVYGDEAYLRDAYGSAKFKGTGLDLHRNDRVSGEARVLVGMENNMLQVQPVGTSLDANAFTIVPGGEVEPHTVTLQQLTPSRHADYVFIPSVQLMEDNVGLWAYSGNRRVRLWQKFNISGLNIPRSYEGRYYNVVGIYGTDEAFGEVVDEIYLTDHIIETTIPAGITQQYSDMTGDGTAYNLQGQRVGENYHGLVIVNGKKIKR